MTPDLIIKNFFLAIAKMSFRKILSMNWRKNIARDRSGINVQVRSEKVSIRGNRMCRASTISKLRITAEKDKNLNVKTI